MIFKNLSKDAEIKVEDNPMIQLYALFLLLLVAVVLFLIYYFLIYLPSPPQIIGGMNDAFQPGI